MFFKEFLSVDDVIAYVEAETGYAIEFEDLQALEREGAIKPVVYLRNIYFDVDFSGFTLDIDKKFISSAYYEPVEFVLLDTIVYNPYREYNGTYLGIESWSHFKLVKIVEGGIDCPDIDAEGLLNIHYQSSAGVGELTSLNEIVYSAIFFRRNEIEQVFHIENANVKRLNISNDKTQKIESLEQELKRLHEENIVLKQQVEELNEPLKDVQNSQPDNLKDSVYLLVSVLKDLVLNPDLNAYHFISNRNSSNGKPSQEGLVDYIDAMNLRNLKDRNIKGILAEANKRK